MARHADELRKIHDELDRIERGTWSVIDAALRGSEQGESDG